MQHEDLILRAIEPEDLDLLYSWENEDRIWFSTGTTRPLSKNTLKMYIDSINDIYEDKQVRLIMMAKGNPVGCIDLFDFDPLNLKVGVGIMIDQKFEGQGWASKGLKAVKKYAFDHLGLHQLYCNVSAKNEKSLRLFHANGFEITGTKKDWQRIGKSWTDEHILQCFNH